MNSFLRVTGQVSTKGHIVLEEMEDNPDKFNEEHPKHVELIKQLDAIASGNDLSEPVVIGGVTIVPVGGKDER